MKYTYHRGSENSQECVDFDLRRENGDYITTCVVNVDLLICGVSQHPCGNGDDEALSVKEQLDVLNLVEQERNKLIHKEGAKSLQDWKDSGLRTFEEYFQPGDIVTEDLVEYFVNILPPRTCYAGFVQAGEAFSHEKNDKGIYKAIYVTFVKPKGQWVFAGWCFGGEITNINNRPGRLEERIRELKERIRKAEQ